MTQPTPENQEPQNAPGAVPPQPPYGGQGGYAGYPPPGYTQPPYGYQPPKKRAVWPWILGGIFLVIFLGIGGCVAFVGSVAKNIDDESKREVTVTYSVTGSGNSVAITYSGRDFNTAQETDASLPWSKDVTIDGLGKTVTLTATNGSDGGTITCEISANGKTLAQQTSSGPFASASCIGSAGDA
ncbi:MmpS family transport accessory protein [Mycolicibacterium sp.]|uniref:MmpS family transport accessory protein n=1 Tax=Mycolicibacterium sp. TaxID=2320850 RepID=UPI00148F6F4B|nr:hypothetical protein [Mycolicibacterium fortuitum]